MSHNRDTYSYNVIELPSTPPILGKGETPKYVKNYSILSVQHASKSDWQLGVLKNEGGWYFAVGDSAHAFEWIQFKAQMYSYTEFQSPLNCTMQNPSTSSFLLNYDSFLVNLMCL